MASSRPDFLPAWATASFALAVSGQQNKVRPAAGWRTNGWDENEEPPCNYENWQMNRVYQWLEFFDNNLIRGAAAFVVADNAPDWMKDLGTSEGTGVAKYICDGTDDDVQIQAAINDVLGAGVGGVVLLSEGTFELGSGLGIAAANDVTIAGMGTGATILKITSGQTSSWDVLTLATAANCMIRDLAIDGNKAGQAGAFSFSGIVIDTSTHCLVRDVAVSGLYENAATAVGISITNAGSLNNNIIRCRVFDLDTGVLNIGVLAGAGGVVEGCRVGYGISVAGTDTRVSGNTVVDGGISVFAGGEGTLVQGNAVTGTTLGVQLNGVNGVVVNGNKIANVTTADGINVTNCRDCLIVANHISLCGWNGIECTTTDDSTISGNHIDSCSQAADATHDGIAIEDGCDNNNITCNTIRTKGAANDHLNGVFVKAAGAPAPGDQWVMGNDLVASSKAAANAISDTGGHARYPLNSGAGALGTEPFQVWKTDAGGSHINADVTMFNHV